MNQKILALTNTHTEAILVNFGRVTYAERADQYTVGRQENIFTRIYFSGDTDFVDVQENLFDILNWLDEEDDHE